MNFLKIFSHDQQVVNDYFRLRRKWRFEKYGPKARGIGFHNFMHRILVPGVVLERKLKKRKLTLLGDRRTCRKSKVPTIYASGHVGGCDVETAFEALRDPCFLFMGDPGPVYRSFDGLMLALNGIIALETRDKTDRNIAKERGIALLKQGGSLLIYPEGAWNITENEPIMKLFPGTAVFALKTGADIVPMALERYGDHYYANIGAEIHYADIKGKDPKTVTAELRDTLATLKWEIWEHHGLHRRADLPPDYAEKEFYPMFAPVMGYGFQDADETRYRDKHQTTPAEAFQHLQAIQPRCETAFLFRKY